MGTSRNMRIFKKYSPVLIARYVQNYFKGRVYIQGRGAYEFKKGEVIMPEGADETHYSTVQEINEVIRTSVAKTA